MAQLIFAEAGRAIGSRLLPTGLSFAGQTISGAALGAALGGVAGRAVDQALSGPVGEVGRLDGLTLMESREGAGIPRVFGRYRVGGQLLWASHVRERTRDRQVGGKGGPSVTEYSYTISFAVGLCEGEVTGVDRVWANGELISLAGLNWRFYPGNETQLADPLIEASEGTAPAFRGLAYLVFEDFPLDDYGARLPQLSFEVRRPVTRQSKGLRDVVTGVNLIPASGEWVYAPHLVRRTEYPGWEETLNRHSASGDTDVVAALDQLEADLPNVTSVNVTYAWFGTDLRCGDCLVRPGVETRDQISLPNNWQVAGENRATAHLISRDEENRPYYGGTPDDTAFLALLDELDARNIAVTLSPFLLMDIPSGNGLPDPYGGAEQASFPWRGRLTSTSDGTAQAREDVDAFFGAATAADFVLSGETIAYSGPLEWSYRRFVLHLAMLAKASGKVQRFLLGSELRGLTVLRDGDGCFPVTEHLVSLAAEVRAILGPGVEISYAADWTEYGAYVPGDGSGDVFFPLDPLWSDSNVDFIGVDWYAPLSDWRDGDHLDAALWDGPTDPAYLASNISGGEGFDWFYANEADRTSQTRTPIMDTAHGEDWIFRVKAIRDWWENFHFERPGGVRQNTSTDWVPESKPIRLIEIGCGAVDKGTNAPNVFVDPKSSESALPPFSSGERDDAVQASAIMALYEYWSVAGENNPVSGVYGSPMVPADGLSVWCYDARPFPAFPTRTDVWSDGANWQTGHWLNGRVSSAALGDIVGDVCGSAGISLDVSSLTGNVPGFAVSGLTTVREAIAPLVAAYSIDCAGRETGLVLSNTPAGGALTIDSEDLIEPVMRTRDVTEHGVKSVRVTFSDPENAYLPASVRHGDSVAGDRDLHLRLPMVLPTANAERLTEVLFEKTNAQRVSLRGSVSPARVDLAVGDSILLPDEELPLRVRSLEIGAGRGFVAEAAAPVFTGTQQPITHGEPPAHVGQPDLVVMDLPNLPGQEDDIRPLVCAFAHLWPRRILVSAGATPTGLSARAELTRPAMIGRLATRLPGGPGDRMRPGLSLEIVFPDASLSSRSQPDMLGGANLMAIETSAGWMLAGFEAADMLAFDRWRISGLLTGISGTEDLSTLGAEVGARAVVLDGAQSRAEFASHEIGMPLLWQTGGALPAQQSLTMTGRVMRPLRPGHLRTNVQSNGDIALSWTRRARHSADRWDTPDVPLLEDALLFRVTVRDGEMSVREIEVNETRWTYSSAMQVEDGIVAPAFEVVQVSPGFGDGVAAHI